MSTKDNKNKLKAVIGVLAVALVAILGYAISLYQDKQDTTALLVSEKQAVLEELDLLKSDYDTAILNNEQTNTELLAARDKVALYIDSLQTIKADVSLLSRYRAQMKVLKKERSFLLRLNDSLRASNTILATKVDSTAFALQQKALDNDSLVVQNTKLEKVLALGANLSLTALHVDAVKERNSGKLVSTTRARRADKIKVCFTVAPNTIAKASDKVFYIQIIGPDNAILGKNAVATNTAGVSLYYSKSTTFYYEKQALDVCDFVISDKDFLKGNYKAVVYSKELEVLGSSNFILK